jgi:hypothetical protein
MVYLAAEIAANEFPVPPVHDRACMRVGGRSARDQYILSLKKHHGHRAGPIQHIPILPSLTVAIRCLLSDGSPFADIMKTEPEHWELVADEKNAVGFTRDAATICQ